MTKSALAALAAALLAVACGGSDADSTPAPADATVATWAAGEGDAIEDLIDDFATARSTGDVDAATALVATDAQLGWGPWTERDTMAAALEWEAAFQIDFVHEDCEPPQPTTAGTATIRCRFLADSAVATAAGNTPGLVCVDFTTDGTTLSHVELTDGPTCTYDFATMVFEPFYDWLRTSHPDADPQAMYDDRLSPSGIDLWRVYTNEYLDETG